MMMPSQKAPKDPTKEQMEKAITRTLQETGAPAFAKYEYFRHDLDGDGRRDAIVLLQHPYKYWCNQHGCTLLVLKAGTTDFGLVSKTMPIRAPFYISPNKTNGWNDLIVRVSGRWSQTKNVAMKFDGNQYPDNPEPLPSIGQEDLMITAGVFH